MAIQLIVIGLVIAVAGIVAFLVFLTHYIFEELREHGQVRQVIDEKDLAEIRENVEGLSAKLVERGNVDPKSDKVPMKCAILQTTIRRYTAQCGLERGDREAHPSLIAITQVLDKRCAGGA